MLVTIKHNNQELGTYEIESFQKEVISFGRQPDNDIVLDYEFVSRIHGVFYREDAVFFVEDLDSTNGIRVNGSSVRRQALQDGDVITISNGNETEKIDIIVQNGEKKQSHKRRTAVVVCSILIVVLVAIITALIIYACCRDKKTDDSNMTEGTTTEQTTDTEEITTTECTDTEETTTEEITTEATTQETTTEATTTQEATPEGYDNILRTYISIILSNLDYSEIINYEYPYEAKCEHTGYCVAATGGGSLDNVGYSVTDFDDDGNPELIIGSIGTSYVWDVYALENQVPVRLFCSGERWQTEYCGDYFYVYGSGGAAYALNSRYIIKNSNRQVLDSVYTAPENDDYASDAMWYLYSTNDQYITENDTLISEEEFHATVEEWTNDACEIPNLIPLSQYQ